jgi:hypothetical protein
METPQIAGADQIERWWGHWTSFHDFYLLTAPTSGSTEGALRIHGWITDWNSTDERGYFKQSRDCVVTVHLQGIHSMNLSTDELPAIIGGLTIETTSAGWVIRWSASYGTDGVIEAREVSLSLVPGKPGASEMAG